MPYRLDEKTHKIFIDAPSATTIVNEVYPFPADEIPKKYLEMGQQKGTCVHYQIEQYIKYGLEVGCSHNVKTHKANFEYLKKWWSDFIKDKEILSVENEVIGYNQQIDLCGIADCIVIYLDKNQNLTTAVIDWKTTKEEHPEKEAMQLVMYDWIFLKGDLSKVKNIIVNSHNKESYEMTAEQMKKGKQDALKGLQLYKEKRLN